VLWVGHNFSEVHLAALNGAVLPSDKTGAIPGKIRVALRREFGHDGSSTMKRLPLFAAATRPGRRPRCLFLLALPLALVACRDSQVASYRIPKEPDAAPAPSAATPAPGAPGPAMTVAAKPVSELTWSAPVVWKAKAPSSMRRGSFDVGEGTGPLADLAITAFPGNVGGDLANVNRWRGQLSLPPITEAELPAALQPLSANGLTIQLVDLAGGAGDSSVRMLGAIAPYDGATWFFKLTGPAAIVGAEKARFLEFLTTVRPAAPGAVAATRPAVAPSAPPPGVVTAAAGIPDLRWSAPAHWQAKPATALRKATYIIPSAAGATAELAVSAFPGNVGGELANVNRWRGQLQLPPFGETELAGAITRLTVHGLPVAVVEFTSGSQRLVGAIVPQGDATWFFKLTGPADVVAAEKPAFLLFLQSLSAP
jgi:hypothetical protein